jgi:hypothetical protein
VGEDVARHQGLFAERVGGAVAREPVQVHAEEDRFQRIEAPRDQSAMCSIRSRKVGSAH